jgi:hypothetical protein
MRLQISEIRTSSVEILADMRTGAQKKENRLAQEPGGAGSDIFRAEDGGFQEKTWRRPWRHSPVGG